MAPEEWERLLQDGVKPSLRARARRTAADIARNRDRHEIIPASEGTE